VVDREGKFLFYKGMEHKFKIVTVRAGESGWEVPVVMGPDSRAVGILVKINKEYWKNLTGGVCSPERLTRITLDFLLRKKHSVFALERVIDIQHIQKHFPDYEDEVRKKLVGAFGL